MKKLFAIALFTAATVAAYAQTPPPQPEQQPEEKKKVKEEMTVTGTRVEGRTATETPAPVDIVDNAAIKSAGAQETGKILQLLEPSFNFSSTTISDGTDIIRPATLRGLGPDQTLVLVNGKRRHQQALINFQQTVGRGSAGYDINTIPASAIERIEILRDGAAAQYGSDAIAGVINIILKGNTKSTDATVDVGQYYKGDGTSVLGAVNSGWGIGTNGFFNFTVEYRDRGETNRAGVATTNLLGWYKQSDFDAGVRDVKLRIGDAKSKDATVWLNSAIPAGPGEFYLFGGWSDRKGDSSGFYRGPGDGRTVPTLYPNGFLPNIRTQPIDTSLVAGYRGNLTNVWKYDASVNWGQNKFKFREQNTVNVSYWYEPRDPSNPTGARFNESPVGADTGTLRNQQTALNFDVTGKQNWGVVGAPVNIAVGVEWRREGYKITPGDPVSYQYGRTNNHAIRILNQNGGISAPGTQGFPGYSIAVDGNRKDTAAYVDLESNVTKNFLGGLAVRYEHYSDFGNTVNGKASGRYDFTPQYSLRGTVSTGFRAPGVQQIFHTIRSTNLGSGGILTDTLSANEAHPLTKAFGIPSLRQETSKNYSIGLVAKPSTNFRVTVDTYRIDIKDRIVLSSYVGPESGNCGTPPDPNRCPIAALLAPDQIGQIQFFTNLLGTKTTGLDLVGVYDWAISTRTFLNLEAALDFNKTRVKNPRSASPLVSAAALFGPEQILLYQEGQPRQHFVISPTLYTGPLKTTVRFNYVGKVAGEGFTGIKQTWSGKWLTDLALTYNFRSDLSFTVGGLNVFDVYPDKWTDQASNLGVPGVGFNNLGFTYGWETLPFGINGGYYYGRLDYRFGH
jgi:iron complex outermembrane receptor protein